MNGSLADPGLTALILWLVLPAALLVGGLCFALWRGRRDWVVLEGRVVFRPEPQDAKTPCEIAIDAPDGTTRSVHLHLIRPKGPPPVGTIVALSHPPGQPEALQPGTPGPLLGGAVAGAALALLCIAIVLGF